MFRAKRQLYILCDIEGASGISPANRDAMVHGSGAWRVEGRPAITSDVKAVCEAASEFGIEEIILNDAHDNGRHTPNVLPDRLPENVRIIRRPYLPGKPRRVVHGEPYGIIIVGQHAMAGGGGFAPHTIARPFAEVRINGLRVGEIGIELALFMGARLLAVIGDQAAIDEAHALCPSCIGVPVKNLDQDWFPPAEETRSVIRDGALAALQRREEMVGLRLEAPFRFTLRPHETLRLDRHKQFVLRPLLSSVLFGRCNGTMTPDEATWQTKTVVGGLYLLHALRAFMQRRATQ